MRGHDVEEFVGCFCSDGALLWDVFETPDRWQGEAALRRATTAAAAARQLLGSRPQRLKKTHVFYSDHRLVGECRRQLDVFFGEGAHGRAG